MCLKFVSVWIICRWTAIKLIVKLNCINREKNNQSDIYLGNAILIFDSLYYYSWSVWISTLWLWTLHYTNQWLCIGLFIFYRLVQKLLNVNEKIKTKFKFQISVKKSKNHSVENFDIVILKSDLANNQMLKIQFAFQNHIEWREQCEKKWTDKTEILNEIECIV